MPRRTGGSRIEEIDVDVIAFILAVLLAQDPDAGPDGREALEQARLLLEQGRPRQALEAARTASLVLAIERLEVGSSSGGTVGSDEAVGDARRAARADALVGRALRDLGRHEEAAAALSRALRGLSESGTGETDPDEPARRAERIDVALDLAGVLARCDGVAGRGRAAAGILLERITRWIARLPEPERPGPSIRSALIAGDLAQAAGEHDTAQAAWRRGRDLARQARRAGDEIQATMRLAEDALATGNREAARSLFASAGLLAPGGNSPSWALALLGSVRAGEAGLALEERLERLEAAATVLDRFGEPQAAAAAGLEAASLCLVAELFGRADRLLESTRAQIEEAAAPCWLLGWEMVVRAERQRLGGDPASVDAVLESGGAAGRIAQAFLPEVSLVRARALRDLGREAEMIVSYERAWELLVRWRCAGELASLPRGLRPDPRGMALEIAEAVLGAEQRIVLGRPFDLAYRALEGARQPQGRLEEDRAVAKGGASRAGPAAAVRTGYRAGLEDPRSVAEVRATIEQWKEARRRWLMRPFDPEVTGLPDSELRDLEQSWRARRRAESLDPVSVCRATGEAPSLAHLRDALPDVKTAYVAYRLGPTASYALAVARDRQVLVRLPGREQLAGSVAALIRGCQTPASEQRPRSEEAETLEMQLCEPLLAGLPSLVDRLLICADAPLDGLPFVALRRAGPGQTPRYIGESFEVSLVTSAVSLVASGREREPHQGGRGTAVVVGPAGAAPGDSGGDLAQLLEDLMTGDACRVARGSEATRADLAAALEQPCSIVQIEAVAGGGQGDDLWRLPGEAGALVEDDIEELGLDADLVVIVGPRMTEASRERLGHTLLAHGARTVLTSRWRPGTELERLFLEPFYQGVARGLTVSQALRLARGMMIRRGGEAANPYAWAWLEHRGAALSWVRLEREREWLAPMVFLLLAALFVATIVMFIMLRRLRHAEGGSS